jgi:hypothetical protein
MYGLCALGFPIDKTEKIEKPDPDPLTVIGYSCLYWVDHLCEWASSESAELDNHLKDGGIVDKFMREKYLYWLEALSLCKSMSKGLVSMAKLETLVNVTLEPTELLITVHANTH